MNGWLPFSGLKAPERFQVCFEQAQMSLEAALQGQGVALDESATLTARYLDEDRLHVPFGLDKAIRVKALFAVYSPHQGQRCGHSWRG